MRIATGVLIALMLTVGGCGGANPPNGGNGDDEPLLTGEETTLTPEELNDEETEGEIPETEPAR